MNIKVLMLETVYSNGTTTNPNDIWSCVYSKKGDVVEVWEDEDGELTVEFGWRMYYSLPVGSYKKI